MCFCNCIQEIVTYSIPLQQTPFDYSVKFLIYLSPLMYQI